jgi:hypothetical protein
MPPNHPLYSPSQAKNSSEVGLAGFLKSKVNAIAKTLSSAREFYKYYQYA